MDNCGNIRLDRYWNFIATPFLFIIVLFGLYVLFTADEMHFTSASRSELEEIVGETTRSLQQR